MYFSKISALILILPLNIFSAVYQVGPGLATDSIGKVPWNTLNPGDTVMIHWRSEPYHERWVIARSGTEVAPIRVIGIPNASGLRPVIDGIGAVKPANQDYWNEERGLIKIGGSSNPPDSSPQYIELVGLEIRNAKYPNKFWTGVHDWPYEFNAAGVYVEKGHNITIRNCYIHDNGNGIFVGSDRTVASRNIRILRNHIANNGYFGESQQHNMYLVAVNVLLEGNFLQLPPNWQGNNVKERSAGVVIRYNKIVGGNRAVDSVEAGSPVRDDPSYWNPVQIYGNEIHKLTGYDNDQVIHVGGDGGNLANYKSKVLFFNNTVLSVRNSTALIGLELPNAVADVRNNIVHGTDPNRYRLFFISSGKGTVETRGNWFTSHISNVQWNSNGTVVDGGGNLRGAHPGFRSLDAQDLRLAVNSPAINAAWTLPPEALQAGVTPLWEYCYPFSVRLRRDDKQLDIGAYEFGDPIRLNGR